LPPRKKPRSSESGALSFHERRKHLEKPPPAGGEGRPYQAPGLDCIFWTSRNRFLLTTFAALIGQEAVVMSEAEQYRRLARELHLMARNLPSGEHRSALLKVAEAWDRLADQEHASNYFNE
jgi:hypothetical protein